MGAGLGISQIAHVITHQNKYDQATKVLTRVSQFSFGWPHVPAAPSAPITENDFGTPVSGTNNPNGRIAIRLPNGMPVQKFQLLYNGQTYEPAPAETGSAPANVKQDAIDTFKTIAGHYWRGYSVELPPLFDRPEMYALFKVGGMHGDRGAVVAYFALGFYHQSFREHHALAVSLLQATSDYQLDTSVRVRT